MNCPNCGSKTYIIDTRLSDKYGQSLKRKRMCYKCKNGFITYEVMPHVLDNGEKAENILMQIGNFVKEIRNDSKRIHGNV